MKAVILAAGIGSRLNPYTNIIPKALMPISLDEEGRFRSILEQLIYQISLAGIRDVVLVVNYKAQMIQDYLGDGMRLGVSLDYVTQTELDGNGGAFYRAQALLDPNEGAFITDCDNFLSDDHCIRDFLQFHETNGNDISVGTFPADNIEKYAIIKVDNAGNPVAIYEKPSDRETWGNIAKSGMMILGRELAHSDKSISLTAGGEYTTTQIIAHAITGNLRLGLYPITGTFKDIGTWNDYIHIFRGKLNP